MRYFTLSACAGYVAAFTWPVHVPLGRLWHKDVRSRHPSAAAQRRAAVKQGAVASESAVEGDTRLERLKRLLENCPKEEQAGGAGGSSTYDGLLRADKAWATMGILGEGKAPEFVTENPAPIGRSLDFDAIVCGGTLGVFMAAALQLRGLKVAVVERGPLRGRKQEWNISEQELRELVDAGVLQEQDLDKVIGIKFNPLRAGFKRAEGDPKGVDAYCPDVLNLGVKPAVLVELARKRLEGAGGAVYESTPVFGVSVRPDGALLDLGDGKSLSCRLVLDCMGNASPVVRQLRWGTKPDGACLVVGSCARGFSPEKNTAGDIIYANSPVKRKDDDVAVQYFWEAFPAGSGPCDRTTYMFAYKDASHIGRKGGGHGLVEMMEDYLELLPDYQDVKLEDLQFQRFLFGAFPTYKASPLPTAFNRVLQIGDAGGMQSPLSFGGFGCLTRHIRRLTDAVTEAMQEDFLDRRSLSTINAYLPSLSVGWMFQRSMSVGVGERLNENVIVDLLSNNFAMMKDMGTEILKPFLQDVIQFGALLKILGGVTIRAPLSIPPLIIHTGPAELFDWTGHLIRLGLYTFLHAVAAPPLRTLLPRLSPRGRFRARRLLESWEYGAGKDYKYELPESEAQ